MSDIDGTAPPPRRGRLARWSIRLGYVLILACLVETTAQIAFRISFGTWRISDTDPHRKLLFDPHPFLVGVPMPSVSESMGGVTMTHNSHGTRGPEFRVERSPGVRRIVAIGGSTTYGTLVTDADAWPSVLGRTLGPGFELVNLGVPGYTSAENLIQTAFRVPELSPDVAIYYLGWNDLQNMHVKGLRQDYSDFHVRQLFQGLGLSPWRSRTRWASIYLSRRYALKMLLARDSYQPEGTTDQLTDRPDPRALAIYTRNLRSIAALCRSMGVRALFVPQLLNDERLTSDRPYGWIPFVRQKDLPKALARYNDAMREVARETGTELIEAGEPQPFSGVDFLDQGHFSAAGNRRFAGLLARYLEAHP